MRVKRRYGNGYGKDPVPTSDPILATLQERIVGLYDDYAHVDASIGALDKKIDTTYVALSNKIETAIGSINAKIDERNRVPWQAWTVAATAIIAIGTLAYWPIKDKQSDIMTEQKAIVQAVDKVVDKSVFRPEYDDAVRRLSEAVLDIRKAAVPRGEHEEKWRSFDAQHADLKASVKADVVNLQHQIDEIDRRIGDFYNPRDALLEDKKHIERLETEVRDFILNRNR